LLIHTKKPIIIDDIATTELLPEVQKAALISGGLRSTLIAPMIWQGRLIGALSVASKQLNAFTVRDVEFLGAVATQVTAIVRMSSLVEELQSSTSQLQQAHEGTVLMLASAAEAHDHTTGRHLQRVRQLTEAIARELGHDDEQAAALGMAATLHDIGKIRVPDSVLGSSNSLVEAEWVLMKQHTLWGSAFLHEQPGFELAASVARHHHERWDGGGYPDGLMGQEIPESALITTVADSFDAMTNHRPYRRGRPVDEAVREIASCSGTQFSPRVVEALVRLFERGALAFVHPDEDELDAA
jgi:putative two-component system response regulator